MNTNLIVFKWDGKRKTISHYMTKGQIKNHIKGIRLLDHALLMKNGPCQTIVHIGNIVIRMPNGDWIYCTPEYFKQIMNK